MTQLIIDGHEAVLPKNFACTVKRENSFFTKSGEYTYDVTLRLDNQVNRELYDFLQRTNKSDSYETNRPAVLIADGHVYCRGTEIVTGWTEDTVTIQIVSGESELNYFIGQDQKVEDLDLGKIEVRVTTIDPTKSFPDVEFCMPTIRAQSGAIYNQYNSSGTIGLGGQYTGSTELPGTALRPQPYLCALLRRLMAALGYTVTENQLEQTQFKHLFIVNTVYTTEFAKMIPGWTVKDFLSEVEKLTGIVFVTDNLKKTCAILLKAQYYLNATQFTINNVIDAYSAEVSDDESKQKEFTASDVSYDMPDHHWAKLMKLPEGFLESATIVDFNGVGEMAHTMDAGSDKAVYRDTTDGRYYIKVTRTYTPAHSEEERTAKYNMEIGQFQDLDREDTTSKLELKITPAPMAWLGYAGCEVIDLGSSDGFKVYGTGDDTSEDDESNADDAEGIIRSFEKEESSEDSLYCAFHNGSVLGNKCPIAYTDATHALMQPVLYQILTDIIIGPEGSLRLQDLEDTYFQGGYQIDTKHAFTIETYDPNVIDPRQVYVILNKRFVCRDVEEVITAEGRQQKWKGTFFPIAITDEALEKRWVLTNGTWDDGAAWLDDGRWNDGPSVDPDPDPDPTPDPPPSPEPDSLFVYIIEAFDNINIPIGGTTYQHLLAIYEEAKSQFYDSQSLNDLPRLYSQNNFPAVYDYYGSTQQRQQAFEKMVAWAFAMTLTELKPSARDTLYQKAYDFWGAGKLIPTYEHRFDSDTNVARLVGSALYATMRDATKISAMRKEVGGSTISYSQSSYEILVDTRLFMPQAPGPYLSDHDVNNRQGVTPRYGESPGGYPVGEANNDHNLVKDQQIYDYVVGLYNLSSTNADLKQRTIQAIADKEYELAHLFGSSRTVTDPTYGTMSFNPVFGAHNLGVTISTSGAIANLVSAVAADCSRTRETLLHQQYGRRRPGQGTTDGSAKSNSQQRALVNFAIEEGDGHTTGYYNQNGDYIKRSDNTHIGDYVDYFQRQLSANSYPSGHSSYIWGVALVLMEVMPDKADKIMKAANDFAQSRVIARYHWMSDTIHGRVIGSVMIPVEHALTNINYASMLAAAKAEYQALI